MQKALNLINTTSPSYPLMASIEATVNYLDSVKGKNHIKKLISDIEKFKLCLDENIIVYSANNDPTKILIKFLNINSQKVSEILNSQYKIEEEFTNNQALLFITGVGTDTKKLKTLSRVLNQIAKIKQNTNIINEKVIDFTIPKVKYTPRAANFMQTKTINKDDSIGLVSGETIVPYPPGIPLIIAGEIISKEIAEKIDKQKIEVIL